ncbi:MAG TPA: hypothetical protein VE990_12395 [Acidimicrobiales bacterium]|nr:hypothetical protein [Acidimicrobiales bacterium]
MSAGPIENIYLLDGEERFAPPECPVLELGVVGDDVFLAIGEWESTYDVRSFKAEAQFRIKTKDLVKVLTFLDQNR